MNYFLYWKLSNNYVRSIYKLLKESMTSIAILTMNKKQRYLQLYICDSPWLYNNTLMNNKTLIHEIFVLGEYFDLHQIIIFEACTLKFCFWAILMIMLHAKVNEKHMYSKKYLVLLTYQGDFFSKWFLLLW